VAYPASVEIEFDPYLTVDSASIAWTSTSGNVYVFDLAPLPPFGCGDFSVYVTVDCNATYLGQTHCSEAHILPDTLCFPPDPGWSGASIQLNATCESDSVFFQIKNEGEGDMPEPQDFIIIEDHIIARQGSFMLPGGADTTIAFFADGATLRMDAEQSPGHPGKSKPCVSVEGCGAQPFSTGFVLQYPLNDADLSIDTDCRENTSSFDPNDKRGFPAGYGDDHFIEPNTDLEYLIRFQNTGTDTAFNVVIRDTLSPLLDIQSVQFGASSHPCRYEIYGKGILKFTFENILLPDSNANEPASHGFIKFRVRQRPDNPVGSEILNSAAIYFDFNAPVITNQTLHTIGKNFIIMDPTGVNGLVGKPMPPKLTVFPNPFDEVATLTLEGASLRGFRFTLLHANGKVVRMEQIENENFIFSRNGLSGGVYFLRLENSQGVAVSGRMILK
jgi:uncharacterized repeat protein (TIGR01451 family)